jgi:heterodisulfide reductase subunit A-like polyferredoxin
MAKNGRDNRKDSKVQGEKPISRRDFVAKGAGAAAGASVFSMSGNALAQQSPADAIRWDYEADIVIIGAGCVGLPAAIRARDLGASVILVDQNFDVGGKMLHSGAQVSLGGGDPCSCGTSRANTTRKASSPLHRCKSRRS